MTRPSRFVPLAFVALSMVTSVTSTGCSKLREMVGSKGGGDAGAVDGGSPLEALLGPSPSSTPPAPSTDDTVRAPTTGMTIPEDFPASVPAYPGSKVTAAVTNDKGGVKSHSLVVQTTDSPDAVAAFYVNAMKRAKQTIDMSAGKTRMLSYHDDTAHLDVSITIAPGRATTTVSIAVATTR